MLSGEIVSPNRLLFQCMEELSNSDKLRDKNNAASIQPVIAALRMIQKSICGCCGRIGHKDDACIIRGPRFLPPSLRRKMNQFNALHGDEPK